mmetsp:Transcript_86495/g.222826  ORF Transcript_86495/g.222826 Transcript_86495/m.222826 type:complete len:284 (+) Transcript_86495:1479-2330(+)
MGHPGVGPRRYHDLLLLPEVLHDDDVPMPGDSWRNCRPHDDHRRAHWSLLHPPRPAILAGHPPDDAGRLPRHGRRTRRLHGSLRHRRRGRLQHGRQPCLRHGHHRLRGARLAQRRAAPLQRHADGDLRGEQGRASLLRREPRRARPGWHPGPDVHGPRHAACVLHHEEARGEEGLLDGPHETLRHAQPAAEVHRRVFRDRPVHGEQPRGGAAPWQHLAQEPGRPHQQVGPGGQEPGDGGRLDGLGPAHAGGRRQRPAGCRVAAPLPARRVRAGRVPHDEDGAL